MCFVLKVRSIIPSVLIAKKDIIVYKRLTKDNQGPFRPLRIKGKIEKWEKGFEYEETTPFKGMMLFKLVFKERQYVINIYGNCFHSYRHYKTALLVTRKVDKVVKMIIPKGALYYKNEKEYVSNRLIYPK